MTTKIIQIQNGVTTDKVTLYPTVDDNGTYYANIMAIHSGTNKHDILLYDIQHEVIEMEIKNITSFIRDFSETSAKDFVDSYAPQFE